MLKVIYLYMTTTRRKRKYVITRNNIFVYIKFYIQDNIIYIISNKIYKFPLRLFFKVKI